jgi:hypothetical protein
MMVGERLPNVDAQQRWGPVERLVSKSLHAQAICCTAGFGVRYLQPSSQEDFDQLPGRP